MRKVLSIIISLFIGILPSVLNPLDSVDYIYDDYHFIQFDNHQSTLKAIE